MDIKNEDQKADIINIEDKLGSKPEERSGQKVTNVILFVLLILLIGAIAFFMYLKNQGLDLKNISLDEVKKIVFQKKAGNAEIIRDISYDINEKPLFGSVKGYLIKSNPERIEFINDEGRTEKTYQISMKRQVLKTKGDYAILLDIGGKEIYVFEGCELLWSKKLDNNIINADVNENGYVSVVQEAKGYKALIIVYNQQGGERFSRTVAENSVFSAVVNSSNKNLIVNKIDTNGVVLGTILEINDMGTEKPPVAADPPGNELIPVIETFKGNNFLTVGDSVVKLYNIDGKAKWEKTFKNILYSAVTMDKYFLVADTDKSNKGILSTQSANIRVYDLNGKQLAEFTPKKEISAVTVYSDVIALNSGKEIDLVNINGKSEGSFVSKSEILNVFFISSKELAVISSKNISIIKI